MQDKDTKDTNPDVREKNESSSGRRAKKRIDSPKIVEKMVLYNG